MEGEVLDDILQGLKGKVVSIPQIDATLTKTGYGADAKTVGDRLTEMRDEYVTANETMQEVVDEIANDYFSKSGGTIVGSVHIKNVDNGHSTIMKNHSTMEDYGTVMEDATKDGKTAKVSLSAALNLLTFADNAGNIRNIHHDGNKPFGSYVGNGSATERTIDTEGIGRFAILYNKDNLSLVTPVGALSIDTSAGTIDWVKSTKVMFLNGLITLATTGEAFNIADKEYFYQVV